MIWIYLFPVNLLCEQFDFCPALPPASEIQSFMTQRGFGFSSLVPHALLTLHLFGLSVGVCQVIDFLFKYWLVSMLREIKAPLLY